MPDYTTYDALYSDVAKEKPGLTKEQFSTDMYDASKSYRLFQNLKAAGRKDVPSDYKQFVETYGFNKPPKEAAPPKQQEPEKPVGYADPQFLAEESKKMLDEQAQKTKETTDRALLLTGAFKKDSNGEVQPMDLHADRNQVLSQKADETFKNLLKDNGDPLFSAGNNGNTLDLYVNSYYNTKNPSERDNIAKTIKGMNPAWQPLTDDQYHALQDAKVGMYLNYLVSHADNEGKAKGLEIAASAAGGPLAGLIMGHQAKTSGAGDIDADAIAYAKATYLGQSAIDNPSHFWAGVWGAISDVPLTNLKYRGAADYNERLKGIFKQNGITTQTAGQAKEFNPTVPDEIAGGLGTGIGMILPMMAGGFAGEAIKATQAGEKLLESDNALMRFTGKMLNTSFSNTASMTYVDWRAPLHGVASGITFSAVDAALDKIGLKATNSLGKALGKVMSDRIAQGTAKALTGAAKGAITGVVTTGEEGLYNVVKQHILGSTDFPNEMGKENPKGWDNVLPSTKDFLANVLTMGLFGLVHLPTENKTAIDDLKKNGFNKLAEQTETQVEAIKTQAPKNESAINDLHSGTPQKAEYPVKTSNLLKTKEAITIPRTKEATDLTVLDNMRNKPTDSKVVVKDLDDEELVNFKKKAMQRNLNVIELPTQDEKGNKTGTRVIAHDPEHQDVAKRIYNLSQKELDGSITPDEIHELGTLEGQDPVKFAEKMGKDYPEHKEAFDKIKNEIESKTGDNYGARNEIASRNKETEIARGNKDFQRVRELELENETAARKYGFLTHKENGRLVVTDKDGAIGTDDNRVSHENKDELIQKLSEDAPTEELKEVAQKSNLNAIEVPDEKGEMKKEIVDKDGKTIMSTKLKTLEDFKDNPNVSHLLVDINGLYSKGYTPEVNLKDSKGIEITPEELKGGIQNALYGTPTPNAERVLEALNEVETKGIDVKGAHINNTDDFLKLPKEAKGNKFGKVRKGTPMKETTEKYTNTESLESTPFRKGAIKEAIKSTESKKKIDYTKGKTVEPEPGTKPEDLPKLISEKSENPSEIIRAYKEEKGKIKEKEESDVKGQAIEDVIGKGGVKKESYEKFGDPNKITMGMGKEFFRKGGKPIDQIAQEASFALNPEGQGTDITPQDVVDYMEGSKYQSKRTPVMKDLEQRFKEVTGQPLTEKRITEEAEATKVPSEPEVTPFGVTEEFIKKTGLYKEVSALAGEGVRGVKKVLGIKDPKQIADLPQRLQPIAKGFNDTKGEFIESFNKNANHVEFKQDILKKAQDYFKKAEETPDENLQRQYQFASDNLISIHEGINNDRDLKNYAKLINEQNSFFIGDKEYYANNSKEIEAMQSFKKPKAPMTVKERQEIKNNIVSNNPDYANAIDYTGEEGSRTLKAFKEFNKAFSYMSSAHNFAPQEIRGEVQKLIRDVKRHLVKNRTSDMDSMHTQLSGIKSLKDKAEQDKVANALAVGRRIDKRKWTNPELKEKFGLSDDGVAAYNKIKELLTNAQDHYISADKAYKNYDKMTPEEKKKFDSTHKTYVKENVEYQPYFRKGEYAVTGHGLNELTKQNGRWFSLHETEKEAKAKAEELKKKGYVGLNPDNSRKEGSEPIVYKMNKKDRLDMAAKSGIPALEQAIDELNLPEGEAKKILDEHLDKLKKEAYNPTFMKTNVDENGNYIHGVDEGWDNMVNSLEDFAHRGIHSKARALAETTYTNNSKFLNHSRYKETKNDLEAWMDTNRKNTILRKGMQQFQNVVYGSYLGFRPKQMVLNVLHNMLTVYPDFANEISILNKEKLTKGEKPVNESGLLLGTRAWGDAANITGHLIQGGSKAPISSMEKLAYHTLGLTGNVEKTAFTKWADFQKTELGGMIDHFAANGTLSREFAGYMDGREAGERKGTAIQGASTGYTDLFTRTHALVLGYHLGKLKGLQGDGLTDYVQNFIDRNKFEWGKSNTAPILRGVTVGAGKTGAEKFTGSLLSNAIQGILMFKQFHLQDLAWNFDMMKRAESKLATGARIVIPRVAIGGGALKALTALGGAAPAMLYGLYNSITGRESNENTRKNAIKILGDKAGNNFMDAMTYGGGMLANVDTRGLMDAGSVFNEDMPLTDQIGGVGMSALSSAKNAAHDIMLGDWRGAMEKLPGELGSSVKAWHWLSIMNNKEQNLPGEKTLYSGLGTEIRPTVWDAAKKAAGFNPIEFSKYYDATAIKEKYVGDGDARNPKGLKGEISSDIFNLVKDTYDSKNKEINEYQDNPTEENFIKAFGEKMYGRINDYNIGLRNELYTALHAMKPSSFKEGTDIADEVRKYGIGMTWADTSWDDTDLSNDLFIRKTIRSAIQSKQLQ